MLESSKQSYKQPEYESARRQNPNAHFKCLFTAVSQLRSELNPLVKSGNPKGYGGTKPGAKAVDGKYEAYINAYGRANGQVTRDLARLDVPNAGEQ